MVFGFWFQTFGFWSVVIDYSMFKLYAIFDLKKLRAQVPTISDKRLATSDKNE